LAKQTVFSLRPGKKLSAEERREVLEGLFVLNKTDQKPFFYRMAVLLVISTVIATSGLLSNSAAVVIGAMLVAPMMRPVMAAAASITLAWPKRFTESLVLVVIMAVFSILISMAMTALGPNMVFIPNEVLARTRPTFFDLVIALAAGSGGAYTLTRKESSAIPGVAMAVALLPPLASAGILIVFTEFELATKAMVLFTTNFFAMILAGALTFMATGVTPTGLLEKYTKSIFAVLVLFVLLVGAISVPLFYYSTEIWFNAEYEAKTNDVLQGWLKENKLEMEKISIDKVQRVISLTLSGPNPPISLEGLFTTLKTWGKERGMKKDELDFSLQSKWVQSVRNSWPPPPKEEMILEEALVHELPPEITDAVWRWSKTQYRDDQWIEPNIRTYFLKLTQKKDLDIQISCKELNGEYQVANNLLSITVKESQFNRVPCDDQAMDNTYLSDLARVVHYFIDDDRLVLVLDNNAGYMYFSNKP
jgi:uncharacterized hydrophobic protein (TIGR00271 family)